MVGRPKQDGARYPSGKLKPKDELAPALVARYRQDVIKFFNDPKLATQLSYLGMLGELTNRQVAAGLRFGEIHNRWRRLERLMRSSPKSASLEGGFSGAAEVAEERMTDDQRAAAIEATQKARADFEWVMEEVPVYPREAHNALLDLCVENQPVPSMLLPEIRTQLNRLAALFDSRDKRKRKPSRGGVRPLRARIEERKEEQHRPKTTQATLRAWDKALAVLRPDLDEDGRRQAREIIAALADRERMAAAKERGR